MDYLSFLSEICVNEGEKLNLKKVILCYKNKNIHRGASAAIKNM